MNTRKKVHDKLLKMPHIAQLLWHNYFCYYVDFKTGIIGLSFNISYSHIREVLSFKGAPGCKAVYFTDKQLRNAIGWLIRGNLLSPNLDGRSFIQGKRYSCRLIFALATLATKESIKSAQKQLFQATKFFKELDLSPEFFALK